MKIVFERKPDFRFREFVIEKNLSIPDADLEQMLCHPLRSQAFLAEHTDLMGQDSEGVYHCVLVTGKERADGLLIESEGADYARYAAYVPEATALQYPSLSKMNRELAAAVDFVVAEGVSQTSDGKWTISFEKLEEYTGLDVLGEVFLQNLLGDMLCERPEVSDLVIEKNSLEIDYHLEFCPNCQPEIDMQSPEMKL